MGFHLKAHQHHMFARHDIPLLYQHPPNPVETCRYDPGQSSWNVQLGRILNLPKSCADLERKTSITHPLASIFRKILALLSKQTEPFVAPELPKSSPITRCIYHPGCKVTGWFGSFPHQISRWRLMAIITSLHPPEKNQIHLKMFHPSPKTLRKTKIAPEKIGEVSCPNHFAVPLSYFQENSPNCLAIWNGLLPMPVSSSKCIFTGRRLEVLNTQRRNCRLAMRSHWRESTKMATLK